MTTAPFLDVPTRRIPSGTLPLKRVQWMCLPSGDVEHQSGFPQDGQGGGVFMWFLIWFD